MSFKDLRSFLTKLDELGELKKIRVEVNPCLEVSEIANRISKGRPEENKALLFENISGYQIPLLINSLGSINRMNIALEANSFNEIANRIEKFLDKKIPDSLMGKLSMLPKLAEVATFPPKLVSNAPCQEVIITNPNEPMLDKLPIITAWPLDTAPFITMTAVVTKDPETEIRNVGMYRMQKIDNSTTCMHWHKHHDGAQNYQVASHKWQVVSGSKTEDMQEDLCREPTEEEKEVFNPQKQTISLKEKPQHSALNARGSRRMEVAVAIGCDPIVMYSASAPLPPGVDEFLFAGFLRSSPVELVKCKTVDLEVPATSEIVLEGYVDLDELTVEGPFGDHTGFYSMPGLFPKFHITCMTHRKDPIYVTTIVGKPPMEDCYMGKATERIFLPLIKTIVPEVVDINLPWEGVFHNCAIVSIKKKYPAHAKKVMSAIWGLGQMMFTKYIIVVDENVNIQDLKEVAFHFFANTDPKRDSLFTEGPTDILDHASTQMGISGKIGFDATKKWKSEGYNRTWPEEMIMDTITKELVSRRWKEYGLSFTPNSIT
ncbi:MAG: UbiD family decarboxylase [Candidatus Melainabacteria bacterium]|nr:UbiD family decarboxylase [Candidatus Melainabacteria bacterium]